MVDYKIVLAVLATVISLIGYVPYFRNMLSGKTKPHAFSWLVWAVITSIGFAAQVVEKAGPGAWVTGFTALICFVVFGFALFKGKKDFSLFDWLCLLGAFVAIALWRITQDALVAVILVSLIDALGFLPTFRKGYHKPHEDTITTFGLNALKFFISLFALETYTITTWLYPVSLVITNGLFVLMVYVRRMRTCTGVWRVDR